MCLDLINNPPEEPSDPLRVDKRSLVQQIYLDQVGVMEATGNNDGDQVEAYLASVGLGSGYPWCAAFVAWVLYEAKVEHNITAWSPTCCPDDRMIWSRAGGRSSRDPISGDIFGIYYTSKKRIGHTGFIEAWEDGTHCITVEGNTDGSGSREGDGVYARRRSKGMIFKVVNWIDD